MVNLGNDLASLYVLKDCKSKRISSYDIKGGNHDWLDIPSNDTSVIAEIKGSGIIRHIWCTIGGPVCSKDNEDFYLRKVVLRMYWDDETSPSIEVPIGDFFGMGHAMRKNFFSAPLSMSPQDGRAMVCYFPMPFKKGAKITIENQCDCDINFYYYIDYEEVKDIGEDIAYFHASWHRECDTEGSAPREEGYLDKEKANVPDEPEWYPKVWLDKNKDGEENYVILDTKGKGKYVGCNLNIDVFERQANDWYGEGDDMIFIDGEPWPPSLHGTGTEDYFNTAFCPEQEFCTPYHGITLYSGDKAGFKWGGKNSMYRFHIKDPIYFNESIKVTIEHGHNNILSNDYSSTAYWYQVEPHQEFEKLLDVNERLPKICEWDKEDEKKSYE